MTSTQRSQSVWRPVLIGAAAAAVVNSATYLAASAGGTDFVVISGDQSQTVQLAHVAMSSFAAIIVGGAVLWLARSRTRVVEALALIATVLSLGGPLTMGSGDGTSVALAGMHVVVGASFIAAAEATARTPVERRSELPKRRTVAAAQSI